MTRENRKYSHDKPFKVHVKGVRVEHPKEAACCSREPKVVNEQPQEPQPITKPSIVPNVAFVSAQATSEGNLADPSKPFPTIASAINAIRVIHQRTDYWTLMLYPGEYSLADLTHGFSYSGMDKAVMLKGAVGSWSGNIHLKNLKINPQGTISIHSAKMKLDDVEIDSSSTATFLIRQSKIDIRDSKLTLKNEINGLTTLIDVDDSPIKISDTNIEIDSVQIPSIIFSESAKTHANLQGGEIKLRWLKESRRNSIYTCCKGVDRLVVNEVNHRLINNGDSCSVDIYDSSGSSGVRFEKSTFTFSMGIGVNAARVSNVALPCFSEVNFFWEAANDHGIIQPKAVRDNWRIVTETGLVLEDDSLLVGENDHPITLTLPVAADVAGMPLRVFAQGSSIRIIDKIDNPQFDYTLQPDRGVHLACTNSRWIVFSVSESQRLNRDLQDVFSFENNQT